MADYDVLVAGGGNAALCAAIAARRAGRRVLVVEGAPKFYRGGNTRHTRNMRCAHDHATDTLTGPYSEDEFFDDLMRVTSGNTDEALSRMMIAKSKPMLDWIQQQGVRFQPSLGGTISLGRTNSFFLGGGRSMLNALYRTAEDLGVEIRYEHEVTDLEIVDGRFERATIRHPGGSTTISAQSFVAACGGFQADLDWLKEGWGDKADNFLVRGTPYNRGTVTRMLIDNGLQQIGDASQCHAVAIDARAPKYDGGIITRLDCVVLGIVVNKNAERFYDEGEDIWPKRYAIWGRLVANQPDQTAFIVFDAPNIKRFMPSLYPPIEAPTLAELAEKLDLDPATFEKTVTTFNDAVVGGKPFDTNEKDGNTTRGLEIEKTNWAQRIDTPPYYAYPVKPGITFTYLGVKVDAQARILRDDGNNTPSDNMFAAGEIMAGNVLGQGYAAGIGMTIGAVFGRIAGEEAARHAT
ncbi:FAD-dependent tricarballylate dehydrogenase TcuA [Palleronia sp. LCG004]|uniref:FAD-dependent tricarballylate dehydrogenase TcuA n=1 Tax=Palleronia sp. LCG004 TaxID=3079304 RepID=UPI002942906B|nr:FAD-dependent tricarballylate dehydrogenase TcuA [Palleronia sp. LCG004]WOI58210.1 FAD-dependent tricarballylate dehydrogenase TcuA [Palleronia sp. LCG004]